MSGSIGRITAALSLGLMLAPSLAAAVEKCSAKVNAKTGVIEVSASGIVGVLTWGEVSGQTTNEFANFATCVAGGKAKKCVFGGVFSNAAVTPPTLCTVFVKDVGT